MLNVQPYRQKPAHCGPACLKMVLDFYGETISAAKLAKLAKTTSKDGTSNENMVGALKPLGFRAALHDRGSLKEIQQLLNKKIPVIVDWFSGFDRRYQLGGHYSVVVGLDTNNIYLQDPELGHLRSLRREQFLRQWFDFTKEIPDTPSDVVIRRMIVIYPKK